MKTLNYIVVLFTAFSCSMCNPSKKDQNLTSSETAKEEKHEHKILSAADSLKLASHSIEVKGNVEFPLRLTVDSLKKMKVYTLDNFKIMEKNGEVKKRDYNL